MRRSFIAVGLLLMVVAALAWFAPARLALPLLRSRLHGLQLQQVQGSLWDGQSARVLAADGQRLGQLHWQLSRRALLGDVRLQLALQGPQLSFSGAMQRLSADRQAWSELRLRAELAPLTKHVKSPLGQPLGELRLTVAHALLQGGWPLELQARAQWAPAIVETDGGELALGNLQLQARALGGVIQAELQDDGHGPLQAAGQMTLSPLGWRLDATLRARQTEPALRRWLARLGTPAADGSVHVQRSGGLLAATP